MFALTNILSYCQSAAQQQPPQEQQQQEQQQPSKDTSLEGGVGDNMAGFTERQLFGGALVIALPERFQDVSPFRQIPDTQEVFADAETDQSIIIELLSLAEETADGDAALFHFNSLAHDNDAASVRGIERFPAEQSKLGVRSYVCGTQVISKFNEGRESANDVQVYVMCDRAKPISTDIVLSLNSPEFVRMGSSSAEVIDSTKLQGNTRQVAQAMFNNVCKTLEVKDLSIFQ